jgi:NAD(P)-dependent dehydrogenase (short-subunit alcohol dehydrogenase family)
MQQQPESRKPSHKGSGRLEGKVVLITGGDSGIGRAVAIAAAIEGAKVAINYLEEHEDADTTQESIKEVGGDCIAIAGDVGDQKTCQEIVRQVIDAFGTVDVLINNAAEQHPQESIADITSDQLERTFRTNIFGMFYMVQAVLPHLKEGSSIINTSSVTAYRGSPELLDYSSTKGAIVAFTRSLSGSLIDKGIRVNGVAPGPIWTPLIPSTFPVEKVKQFGADVPMKRSGEPSEVAPAYVFLASDEASYITGQFIHVNGGELING